MGLPRMGLSLQAPVLLVLKISYQWENIAKVENGPQIKILNSLVGLIVFFEKRRLLKVTYVEFSSSR